MYGNRGAMPVAKRVMRLLFALPALYLAALYTLMGAGYTWVAFSDSAPVAALIAAGTLSFLPATLPVLWWLFGASRTPRAREIPEGRWRPGHWIINAVWAVTPAAWPLNSAYAVGSDLFAGTPSMWQARLADGRNGPLLIWAALLTVTYGVMWLHWALPLLRPNRSGIVIPSQLAFLAEYGGRYSRGARIALSLASMYLLAAAALPTWQLVAGFRG